jgi:hypothetical protein
VTPADRNAATVSERAAMWERLCDHFSEELVARWNESFSRRPLHEFMGLSEEQYAAWVEGRWADVLA